MAQYHPDHMSAANLAAVAPRIQAIGNPGQPYHFWDQTGAAYSSIEDIYNRGPQWPLETIVVTAWDTILHLYFPSQAVLPGGLRWRLQREAYRNPTQQSYLKKPDILALQLIPMQPQLPNSTSINQKRDYLWVECKAPNLNTPSGWKNAITEATGRLNEAHPQRKLWLIVAIGMNHLMFTWDPHHTIQHQQLCIRAGDGSNNIWYLDQRLKCVNIGLDRWYDPASGEINLARCFSLECWNMTVRNGGLIPQNIIMLAMLEHFLLSIQYMPLQGLNNPMWD